MKSQRIRSRNLTEEPKEIEDTIQLKPKMLFAVLLIIGFLLSVFKPYMLITGISIILLSIFALVVMPDGRLCQIRKEYIVLYNNPGTDLVTLVYWDEIVKWSYEWHSSADLLVFELKDGSTETQEMYSRLSVSKALKRHLPDKEKKQRRKQLGI